MTKNMPAPEAGFDEFDQWARRNLPLWNHTSMECMVNEYDDEVARLRMLAEKMAGHSVEQKAMMTDEEKEEIVEAIEAVKQAGTMQHGITVGCGEYTGCPVGDWRPGSCECGAYEHNKELEAACVRLTELLKAKGVL